MAPKRKPTDGEILGNMYKRWTMDCINDVALGVSLDFSKRWALYQNISDPTADMLTDFQCGTHSGIHFPNRETRNFLFGSIFGASDGEENVVEDSVFKKTRKPLIAAAADFSENAQPTGFPMLRQRISDAAVPLKAHLVGMTGASLRQTESRTRDVFDIAAAILRDPDVCAVFGIGGTIDSKWPLESEDPLGARLIAEITGRLAGIPTGPVSHDRFVRIQRIAQEGFDSIRLILDKDIDKYLKDITIHVYAWGSGLGLLNQ